MSTRLRQTTGTEQDSNSHWKMSNVWKTDRPSFEFVHGEGQPRTRSHAMRESWKQRRRARQDQEDSPPNSRLSRQPHNEELPLPLLEGCATCSSLSIDRSSSCLMHRYLHIQHPASPLDSAALQSFQSDRRAHELLHHWVTAYVPKMVDQQHLSDFPIVCRVLLNTTTCTFASLNIALAHSANHLAHLRVSEVPIEVTKFKFAAIKQIRSWIEDSALAYSYNMTGALLQLITYERYWGQESEWRLHKNGLKHILTTRCRLFGIEHDRQLLSFISSMAVPSWFSTSNDLSAMIKPHGAKLSGDRMCTDADDDISQAIDISLYLLFCSIIQDLRNFKYLPCSPISGFKRVIKAARILQEDVQNQCRNYQNEKCDRNSFTRLSCILLLGVVAYQSSIKDKVEDLSEGQSSSELAKLDGFLGNLENTMQYSVCELHKGLFDMFVPHLDDKRTAEYVASLTDGISRMSADMCREIEDTIIRTLLRDE